MKHIDADKLIAEIKRYKNKADNRLKIQGRTFAEEQKDVALQNLCGNLLHFIASHQKEQERPEVQNGKFVFPKYLYARTKDNKTIDMSYGPQDMTAIEYIRNDFVQSGLDEAAEKYSENILANNEDLQDAIEDAFKAGAEWYDNQMKMPSSSELISAWRGVKSILQEKDFRGDEWRLAYNAFMFGFSRGINTQKTEK